MRKHQAFGQTFKALFRLKPKTKQSLKLSAQNKSLKSEVEIFSGEHFTLAKPFSGWLVAAYTKRNFGAAKCQIPTLHVQ